MKKTPLDSICRKHRFVIKGHKSFVFVKSVKFYQPKKNNKDNGLKLGITFYLEESIIKDVLNIQRIMPKDLNIALLKGNGEESFNIVLNDIKFSKFSMKNFKLDYGSTHILTLELLFTYQDLNIL